MFASFAPAHLDELAKRFVSGYRTLEGPAACNYARGDERNCRHWKHIQITFVSERRLALFDSIHSMEGSPKLLREFLTRMR